MATKRRKVRKARKSVAAGKRTMKKMGKKKTMKRTKAASARKRTVKKSSKRSKRK